MLAHLRGLPRALQRPHVGDYWTAWSGPGDDSGARVKLIGKRPREALLALLAQSGLVAQRLPIMSRRRG